MHDENAGVKQGKTKDKKKKKTQVANKKKNTESLKQLI